MGHNNLCYSPGISCSACCGINNINLNQNKKIDWLKENTHKFLELNLMDRIKVLKFRNNGEVFLKKLMIRPDVYICPFIGFTGEKSNQTGCLLNSEGSPHSQIKKIDSPLHYSFYGENICKSYDCISKQNLNPLITKNVDDENLSGENYFHGILTFLSASTNNSIAPYIYFPGNLNILTYGKFISNHNLIAIYHKINEKFPGRKKALLSLILAKLENMEIPVTSFEMSLTFEFFTDEELWQVLGTLFTDDGYFFDAFKITPGGKIEGNKIQSALGFS